MNRFDTAIAEHRFDRGWHELNTYASAYMDVKPMAARGHLFAESCARDWWGRLLDTHGRAPAKHVRLFWETETRGRRVRVANVGAAFLPAGKMRSAEHPAYSTTLRQFERYPHSDGNVTDAWAAGTRGPEDVWREWCRIGFATIEHAHRALNELANIAEAEWARDPFFDVAAAVKPFDIGPDNPGDAEPALHGPANRQAVTDTVREIMAGGQYDIDDLPALELDRIGRKLWGKPVSAIRARRLAGKACRAIEDIDAKRPNGPWLVYENGGEMWMLGWDEADNAIRLVGADAVLCKPSIVHAIDADDPHPRLWEYVPRGFFRRGDA